MKHILLGFLTLTVYTNAFDYQSTHDETYWYPDDENTLDGYHIGTVRSNLVWGDAMRFFVDEQACDQRPFLTFIFSTTNTSDLAKEDRNFAMNSFVDQTITFDMEFDSGHTEKIVANIWSVSDENPELGLFIFMIPEMPMTFASTNPDLKVFNKFMSLTVSADDPLHYLFDEPKRSYRMEGLVPVWMYSHEKCLEAANNGDKND